MKKRTLIALNLCVVAALLSSGFVSARDTTPPELVDGTIVRVYYPDLDVGNKVLMSFEPWLLETNYEESYHVMQVTREQIDRLAELGLRVERDDKREAPAVLSSLPVGIESIPSYPCYRTVEETFASAQALATDHPELATWTDVGDSWEKFAGVGGYDMMVLKLTNSAIPGEKPKLFVTSAIHAREYATAELVTRFAEYLVDNHGVDADATWILDHHELHLMLHTNPDGRKKAETGLSWRKNTNQNYCSPTSNYRGADLNRNFDFYWDCCGGSSDNECDQTYHGAYPASEPETQAVQAYMASIFPDQRGEGLSDPAPDDATGVYIDVHSYGRLVLWPWGFTSGDSPNATGLQTLGRKWAYFNEHTPQQANELYITDGSTKDYAYGVFGVPGYTWEVGTAFFQSCSYFESTLLPDNMPALIYAAKVVRTPYMTPAGPDALGLALSDSEVPAGTSVSLDATVDDTRYNNSKGSEPTQSVAAAEYYIDVPPWMGGTGQPMGAVDGSFNETIEGVTATVDTTALSTGRHILFVRGRDAEDNWGAFSATFLTITGPPNQPPTANSQSVTTDEDTPVDITLTGSDPEGNPLTFMVTEDPSHGTLSGTAPQLTYTPDADYHGPDSFQFVVNDGTATSDPAAVSITVNPVNDAPVAEDQSVTTEMETPVDITLTGSDVDGDPLTFSLESDPSHGTLSGTVPNLTYTPDADFAGDDSFTFSASDGEADSNIATVSVTVYPPGPITVFFDDFETDKGWERDPRGTDTAARGLWERAIPEATGSAGHPMQLSTTVSGVYDLVTGHLAGTSVGSYDVDAGVTSIRSPSIAVPEGRDLVLSFSYYLAHLGNSSSTDYFRVRVVGSTNSTVFEERGAATIREAAWVEEQVSLNAYAGETIYVLIEAADENPQSLVEAAVDDVMIVAQPYPTAVDLLWFRGTASAGAIELVWETASEIDNLGFNLYRADTPDGERTRINEALIPSRVYPGSPFGAVYSFRDRTVRRSPTSYYWLEDVDIYGGTELHGPVKVERARRLLIPVGGSE